MYYPIFNNIIRATSKSLKTDQLFSMVSIKVFKNTIINKINNPKWIIINPRLINMNFGGLINQIIYKSMIVDRIMTELL